MPLLGTSMDDPQTAGILALAGSMIRGDMGGGLLGYGQAVQAAQNGLVDRQDKLQQIQLRALQAQMAQQKMGWLSGAFGDLNGPAPAAGSMSGPAIPPSPGGALGSGTFGIPTGGQQAFSPQTAPQSQGGGNLVQQARALGIPDAAIRTDLMFNEGKGIPEMIYKRGVPNIEFQGGVALDKNKLQAGFSVPQIAQNGQASQLVPDPTAPGGFRVIAPQGAVDTFSGYQDAQERSKARLDPLPQSFVDRRTGLPIGGSRLDYLSPSEPPQQGGNASPVGNGASVTPELRDRILADARQNGITNPQINLQPPPGYKSATFGSMPPSVVRQPVQLQSPAEAEAAKVTATKAAESGQAYKDALDSKVEEEFQLVNRNKQISPLLDKFKTGGFLPEERLHLGNMIANSGALPDSLKQTVGAWVANGDPTAGKVIENQLASAGILNMLQTLDKEGKPNRAIFQAVQKAQEGLASGNTTLKDVFELQNRLYGIHYDEQQALTKSIKDGSYDPRTWAGDYAAVRNAGLAAPAAPLPSASTPTVHWKYVNGKLVRAN